MTPTPWFDRLRRWWPAALLDLLTRGWRNRCDRVMSDKDRGGLTLSAWLADRRSHYFP